MTLEENIYFCRGALLDIIFNVHFTTFYLQYINVNVYILSLNKQDRKVDISISRLT